VAKRHGEKAKEFRPPSRAGLKPALRNRTFHSSKHRHQGGIQMLQVGRQRSQGKPAWRHINTRAKRRYLFIFTLQFITETSLFCFKLFYLKKISFKVLLSRQGAEKRLQHGISA
jgi:hypothetical protein